MDLKPPLLTQGRDIHQHEVASLGDNRGHSGIPQDGGQTVPLALQLLRQGGEVGIGQTHQLQVVKQTLSHGLLREQRAGLDSTQSRWRSADVHSPAEESGRCTECSA